MFIIRSFFFVCLFLLALPLFGAWTAGSSLPDPGPEASAPMAEVGFGDFLEVLGATAGDVMDICDRKPEACIKALEIFDVLKNQALAASAELHARLAEVDPAAVHDADGTDSLF